eukprot:4924155-Karenia_brevis.AAC.1
MVKIGSKDGRPNLTRTREEKVQRFDLECWEHTKRWRLRALGQTSAPGKRPSPATKGIDRRIGRRAPGSA